MAESPQQTIPGMAVDVSGAPVVDPTKNVEDLVKSGIKAANALRDADIRFQDAEANWLRESAKCNAKLNKQASVFRFKIANEKLNAETRRIDQLASTRQEFQNTIRDMLAESVRTTSTLVSTQLVQIQATFDTRVSKLEAAAFTQAGRTSVSDPAISDAIVRMSQGLSSLKSNTDEVLIKMAAAIAAQGTKAAGDTGERVGQGQMIAWVFAGIGVLAAIASPLITLAVK